MAPKLSIALSESSSSPPVPVLSEFDLRLSRVNSETPDESRATLLSLLSDAQDSTQREAVLHTISLLTDDKFHRL